MPGADMTRDAAWDAVHEALPAHWTPGRPSRHPSSGIWTVTAIRREGSTTIGYGTADDGHPVLSAGDPRMMAEIAAELADTLPAVSWQRRTHPSREPSG